MIFPLFSRRPDLIRKEQLEEGSLLQAYSRSLGDGEFSSDLYRALVCDIIIRKCIIRILYFSGLFLSTSMTLNDIK